MSVATLNSIIAEHRTLLDLAIDRMYSSNDYAPTHQKFLKLIIDQEFGQTNQVDMCPLSNNIVYDIYRKLSWHDLKRINNIISDNNTLWYEHYVRFFGTETPKYVHYKQSFMYNLYDVMLRCLDNLETCHEIMQEFLLKYPWLRHDKAAISMIVQLNDRFYEYILVMI
jgi:hypothetical protein